MVSGRCAPATRGDAPGRHSKHSVTCQPIINCLSQSAAHCILESKLQGLWPHRAVAAGQAVPSGFLEGTWNARRVLFSGFA